MPYSYTTIVRLADTDAAGIVFFANYFRLAHEAVETMFTDLGFSVRYILEQAPYILPLVHADMDYRRPLRAGDSVTVEVTLEQLGESSVTLKHRFMRGGEVAAEGRTVHVSVDRRTQQAVPLEDILRNALRGI